MRTLVFLLAFPLAACGGGSSNTTTTTEAAPTATATPAGLSEMQQSVVDLPDAQRRGVFIRALRDGDIDCQGVTSAERRDDLARGGEPTWIATCQGGATYAISITRDGTAVVVSNDGRVDRAMERAN